MVEKFKVLPFVLALSFLFSFGVRVEGATQAEIQKKIDQTKQKLSQTKVKEKSVLSKLLTTQKELDRISANLKRLNSQMGDTEKRIRLINSELIQAEADLGNLRKEIFDRQKVLNQRLVAIYKYGYQSYLEILVQSQNFGEFITRFELIGNVVHKDLQLLGTLQHQLNSISRQKLAIGQKQAELEREKKVYVNLQSQTKVQQSQWTSRASDQQQQLSDLQNDRRELEAALDEFERISKSMESQIREYQNKNRDKLGTGQMLWPLPVKGRISSYFGNRMHPILKKRRYHSGVDIAVPTGTPIFAADDGVVIFSNINGGYGKMVSIDHGAGISTVYAHCSSLLVRAGQKVSKGQKIALVGTTGLSTGPHLHFEVRKDGVPTDPLAYIQ